MPISTLLEKRALPQSLTGCSAEAIDLEPFYCFANEDSRLFDLAQRFYGLKQRSKLPRYFVREELIGPATVNTLPLATLKAFRDRGRVRGDTSCREPI
jgi:hypothetical protein